MNGETVVFKHAEDNVKKKRIFIESNFPKPEKKEKGSSIFFVCLFDASVQTGYYLLTQSKLGASLKGTTAIPYSLLDA